MQPEDHQLHNQWHYCSPYWGCFPQILVRFPQILVRSVHSHPEKGKLKSLSLCRSFSSCLITFSLSWSWMPLQGHEDVSDLPGASIFLYIVNLICLVTGILSTLTGSLVILCAQKGPHVQRYKVLFTGFFFTNKYLNIWGHMNALHLLFHSRYCGP